MQTSDFSVFELLLYIIPLTMIFLIKKYGRPYLTYFKNWPITLAICLLPTLFVLIYGFGWLIFGFNVLPFIILFSSFSIGVQLHKYMQEIDCFYFNKFYLPASELLFYLLVFHLVGMILLRWWTIFF
ncbi:hypothetical protein [Facklamia sp. 7083-14-GEN3]|uniref:hypothetical protein n=1 Tax=Facklamia sp. 7083-14-GEN3 TaxID=2973478 RepID=UPI00215CAC04|nr:hypothetical protein [Facklamia sp. 7083-14-GEN3]MCR8969166.1 hypothetical protein [Facklamia sp. 7083-14-GEN3]